MENKLQNKEYNEFYLYLSLAVPFLLITGPFLPDLVISVFSLIFIFKIFQFKNYRQFFFTEKKIFFFVLLFFIYINLISIFSIDKYLSFKNTNKKFDLLSLLNDKKFDLIINCEANNILTKKYMKEFIYKNYNNKAFTTIINHSKIKNDKAIQIFTEYGPIAFLPLSDKSTSIVFSVEMKNLQISKDEINKLIKKFNPIYKIVSQENIESFDLKLKLPKKYFHKNILFFGDTLHSIHPLAGQGFNMTIRDMIKFDELINKRINLGLSIDKSIYGEFENISKAYNSSFSFGIDFIYEFFRFNKKFIPKTISEEVFNIINNNKKIKNIGIKIADQGYF